MLTLQINDIEFEETFQREFGSNVSAFVAKAKEMLFNKYAHH